MTVHAYVLIEADQTRVQEIKETLPEIELDGSRVVKVEVVTGPFDLIATVESTNIGQLGRRVSEGIAAAGGVRRTLTCLVIDDQTET